MFRHTKKAVAGLFAAAAVMFAAVPAMAAVDPETAYVFNTFSFLFNGALVMWMAAGFAMLESGLVRSKNTATICLKNIALYSIAGIMFYLVGYSLMYTDVSGYIGSFALFYNPSDAELTLLGAEEATARWSMRSSAADIPLPLTGSSRWSSWPRRPQSCREHWQSASSSGRS